MFSPVNVGARDIPSLARFYDAVLARFGLARAGAERSAGSPACRGGRLGYVNLRGDCSLTCGVAGDHV